MADDGTTRNLMSRYQHPPYLLEITVIDKLEYAV